MTDHVIVLCTCPDDDTVSGNIAEQLVALRLAACVNILPGVRSVYTWQNQICQGGEQLLLIKTRRELYPKLEAQIKALHPYELPEIVMISLDAGLPGYLNWIDQSTR